MVNDFPPFQYDRSGPTIGILVGPTKNKNGFLANLQTLRNLHQSLEKRGATCIVLTPDSFKETYCEGYLFYPSFQKWAKVRTPLPDIVYNRIPYRHMEVTSEFEQTVTTLKKHNIPFFNPHFFTKWDLYRILSTNEIIYPFLPHTTRLLGLESIESMLEMYKEIYIKASNGYKGKGIFKVTQQIDSITVETPHYTKAFKSSTELWTELGSEFCTDHFIIQNAIQPDQYQGKRYDLRILSHYRDGNYIVSGIGIRISGIQEVTTHVPNGGSILPFEKMKSKIDETLLHKLIAEIGNQLSKQLGFIGEFSVDIGKSVDGDYYIYEINSKPMIFDEPSIQQQGLENLTELLIMKARKQ